MAEPGRILIADDEEFLLQVTADLLRQEGYDCATAQDANSAEELLSQERYDLLIADIRMPGNTELELIRNLPNIGVRLPVILMTGYPSLGSAIQSIQMPVVAYMIKPLDYDELLTHVRYAIDRSKVFHAILRQPTTSAKLASGIR